MERRCLFHVKHCSLFGFRGDFLNAFSMVSLEPPVNNARLAPTATSPANPFGQITDTVKERRNVQLALKFVF